MTALVDDTKLEERLVSRLNDSGFQSFSSEEEVIAKQPNVKKPSLDNYVVPSNDYLNRLGPDYEMSDKAYSLDPDMISGWRPKFNIISPIPFKFDCVYLDYLIKELTKDKLFKYKVVYLGFRPIDSFDLHDSFSGKQTYIFRYMYLKHSKAYELMLQDRSKNDKGLYNTKLQEGKANGRPFIGMNPEIGPNSLVFDSFFESGNLDCVVKVTEYEYDLFMRVDSNTKGHLQWYYFCVRNTKKNTKLRFNICNFTKDNSLYLRGMKPYVFSKLQNESKGTEWTQEGQNLFYTARKLQYDYIFNFLQVSKRYYSLSFDYEFLYDNDEVYFAYCIPYTYSKLVSFIAEENIKQKKNFIRETKIKINRHLNLFNCLDDSIMKQTKLGTSLSGVDIPLLTITDFENKEIALDKRRLVLISARIHPGETNGSWMMHGLLQFLLGNSTEAQFLRKRVVFKIIPMLNPDGVILGNYRTSFAGRDLNRQFKDGELNLFPCVKNLKELAREMKSENFKGFFCFIDLHGHSAKRNVFTYGPEYNNNGTMFLRSRVIPKMLAKKTEMFRYSSCRFQIPTYKRYTGRGHMFLTMNIPLCYTVEASFGSFSKADRSKVNFDASHFCEMGAKIAEVLYEYLYKLERLEIFKMQKQMNKARTGNRYRNTSFHDTVEESENSEYDANTGDEYEDKKDGRCKSLETIDESVKKINDEAKKEKGEEEKIKKSISKMSYCKINFNNLSPKRKTIKLKKSKNPRLKLENKIKSAQPKSSRPLYDKGLDSDSDFEIFFKDVLGDLEEDEGEKQKRKKLLQESDDAISEGRSDSESSDEDIGEEDYIQFKEQVNKESKTFTKLVKQPQNSISQMKKRSKMDEGIADKMKTEKKRNRSQMLSREKVKFPQLTSMSKICFFSKDEILGGERKINTTQENKRKTREAVLTSNNSCSINSNHAFSSVNNNLNSISNANNMSLEFTSNPMQAQLNQIHKQTSRSSPLTLINEKHQWYSKLKTNDNLSASRKTGPTPKQPYSDLTTINLHYITKNMNESSRNYPIASSNAVHRILKNIDNKTPAVETVQEEKKDIKPTEFAFDLYFPSQSTHKAEDLDDNYTHSRSKTNVPAAFYSIRRHHQRMVERRKVGDEFGTQVINKSRNRVLSGAQKAGD